MGKQLAGYPSVDKPWLNFYSDEAIHATVPQATIFEYIWEQNKERLDRVALNYIDRRITYRTMFENIEKAANAFSSIPGLSLTSLPKLVIVAGLFIQSE